ncbi:transporter [Clostridiales bacterium PH28_bin88]|nr:transporter [Clostridiales bacterium PH28_bin88]
MFKEDSSKVSVLFVVLACFFVTFLLISNIIAGKLVQVSGVVLPAAVILFPVTYIFGDVLTEVYGFKRSRLIIWVGFAANVFMALIFLITVSLPYPAFWSNQEAYAAVLGFTPRIVVASLIAYCAGEFSNSVLLSKIKLITGGRMLWVRTIGSTVVGEGIDTLLFISVAFYGLLPVAALVSMVVAQYIWKVGYEIAATPLTYALVRWVKRKEGLDVFDHGVRYNPFSLEV